MARGLALYDGSRGQTFIFFERQVGAGEYIIVKLGYQQHACFIFSRKGYPLYFDGAFLAENADAVFAALQVDAGTVGGVIGGLLDHFFQGIGAFCACCHTVDFLYGNNVCVQPFQ